MDITLQSRTLVTLCIALLCLALPAAEVRTQAPASRPQADFHAFVNWNFRHRQKLKGWRATAAAIRHTLEQCHYRRLPGTFVENGSKETLREFLHALPNRSQCDLSIVYLASHQSADAKWDFVQRGLEPMGTIVTDAKIPRHSNRIVILDTCFAASVRQRPAWDRDLGSATLFAASATEETRELDFSAPQPIDLRRRYPAAAAWLDQHMGREWNGRLSFLGFVWVQTFVTSKTPPTDGKGWAEFLRCCERTAEEFRQNGDRRLASRVTFIPAPHVRE
ncbi:MAG: hypothetical protein NTV08_11530 [Verrucomicrobia bacterium]|nr:hypothetical protein [Verrucomicrobiota bacterium]